jgi:hypothetical protein
MAMQYNWTVLEAEYQGKDIDLVSTDPLVGRLELMAEDDEVIEVTLDRVMAETLLSALLKFLGQGEGADASRVTAH